MSSSAPPPWFARSSSPFVSCDDDGVVHHSLSLRIAFRLRAEQTTIEKRGFCNLRYDARARPSSPRPSPAPVLSPGARFDGGMTPRPENHVDLHRRPEHDLRRAASLYVYCTFRDRAGSGFRSEPVPHLPGVRRTGLAPDCAAFVDGAHHFFTTCRLATTRRAIMASDVGRGLRAAPCREREGPVRAHSSREWSTAGSPPRGKAPNTLCRRPGCVNGWRAEHALAVTPWSTKAPVRAAPREGGDASEDQSAWIRSVGTAPAEGLPLGSRSSGLLVTPPLAGHCHRGEPALGLPLVLASR